MVIQEETKAAGTFTRVSFSAETAQAATVTLPMPPSSTNDPAGAGTTVYWTPPSKLLDFAAVGGANSYSINLVDNASHAGQIITNQPPVTVPTQLYTDVISQGAGWDASLTPSWMSISDLSKFMGHIGPNGPAGMESLQGVIGPSTNTVDVIP